MNQKNIHLYFVLGCTIVLMFITGNWFSTSIATETNYSKLENLLEAKRWQEADEETLRVIVQVMNVEGSGRPTWSDIKELPCQDLQRIDQLWRQYSNGKFGFRVQQQIFLDLGGQLGNEYPGQEIFIKFGDRVGWRMNGAWLSKERFIFDSQAPRGHLPAALWPGECDRGRSFWCENRELRLLTILSRDYNYGCGGTPR